MKRLLVIVGDLSGAPELSELDFVSAVKANFSTDYSVKYLIQPTDFEAIEAIQATDALILFAHGSSGKIILRPKVPKDNNFQEEWLTFGDFEHLRLTTRFDFIWIAACHTVQDHEWVEFWLNHTDRLIGFDTITFGRGATDPILIRRGIEPSRIQSPGFRDWYPHPRHIWPERYKNDWFRLAWLWKWPIGIGLLILFVVWQLLVR